MDKMLDVYDVMQLFKVAKATAYAMIREVNEKRNCKVIKGRVPESAIKKEYGLN